MSDIVLKVENLNKVYRLGEVGTGTISHDLNRWWARIRGKEDPFSKVGTINDRTQKAQKGEYVNALRDINFEVKKGEVLGIIGKNGAGKSTLLKVISQITAPTSGSIKAKGRIASLLEVGTGMHPEMTGRENVYLNGTILGMTKKEVNKKFEEIMEFAGCLKYADTPVKRYSSGMRVRLGFAVAAFLEPEILIVDEVLAVGDAEFQKKAIGKMQDISEGDGRTVLFVSHNMQSVKQICSRAILLENGEVEMDGDTNEIIIHYLNKASQSRELKNTENFEEVLGRINTDSELKFEKVVYTQSGKEIPGVIQNGEPFTIGIQFRLTQEVYNLRIFFDICDEKENIILRSFYKEEEYNGINVEKGEYLMEAQIPSNFLVLGNYYVVIHAGIVNKKKYPPEKGLKIPLNVEETSAFNRSRINKQYRGLVMQSIPWTIYKDRKI